MFLYSLFCQQERAWPLGSGRGDVCQGEAKGPELAPSPARGGCFPGAELVVPPRRTTRGRFPAGAPDRSRARDCGVEILVCAVSAECTSQVNFAGLYQTGYGWVPGTPGILPGEYAAAQRSTPGGRSGPASFHSAISEEPVPRSRVLILRLPAAPEHIWAFLPQQMSRMGS